MKSIEIIMMKLIESIITKINCNYKINQNYKYEIN